MKKAFGVKRVSCKRVWCETFLVQNVSGENLRLAQELFGVKKNV